jgi:dienelactone hydrolase
MAKHGTSLPLTVLIITFVATTLIAQQPAPFKPPQDLNFRRATIMSEGSRLAAELFSLKSLNGPKLPTIIMSHGWGGTAAQLRADAAAFARAGYLVVTFDYRGWGASESRVILARPAPTAIRNHRFTAEVIEVREVVDPLDQANDLQNVIHWVQGEPQCDTNRIGLWGSSFSGGNVVYAAERDRRIKALVSQVPPQHQRWVVATPEAARQTYREATARARGEIGYPPAGIRVVGNRRGAPIREKMINFAPVDGVDKAAGCAMLFILAENEEYFDNKDHGLASYARAKGPKKLVTIPKITHYGIYTTAHAQAQKLAIEWFDANLKGEPKAEAKKAS